jgi:hypothetical protein
MLAEKNWLKRALKRDEYKDDILSIKNSVAEYIQQFIVSNIAFRLACSIF